MIEKRVLISENYFEFVKRRFEEVGKKASPVGTRCDLDGDPSSCHQIDDRTGRWKR